MSRKINENVSAQFTTAKLPGVLAFWPDFPSYFDLFWHAEDDVFVLTSLLYKAIKATEHIRAVPLKNPPAWKIPPKIFKNLGPGGQILRVGVCQISLDVD